MNTTTEPTVILLCELGGDTVTKAVRQFVQGPDGVVAELRHSKINVPNFGQEVAQIPGLDEQGYTYSPVSPETDARLWRDAKLVVLMITAESMALGVSLVDVRQWMASLLILMPHDQPLPSALTSEERNAVVRYTSHADVVEAVWKKLQALGVERPDEGADAKSEENPEAQS